MKHRLVNKNYLLPFILVTSLFFMWGFARNFLDVFNKFFQEALVISRTQSSLFQVVFYLGYFLMALPAGWVTVRQGYRYGMVTGLLLFAVGSFMFVPGSQLMSFNFFLLSLFVIACGLVFLEIAANPYMTELGDPTTAASRLNLAQTFNGLGAACGPVVGGTFLFAEQSDSVNLSLPYLVMGIFVLLVAIVFMRVSLPEIKQTASTDTPQPASDNKLFFFGVAALLCYEIAEISINSSFINFAVDDVHLDKLFAARVQGACLIMFMLGRFAGCWVMQYVRAERTLLWCAVCTVVATALVMSGLGVLSFVALSLVYLLEAIMFPTIFSLCVPRFSGGSKRASSMLMMTPIGGAIGTWLVFSVADATTMSFSFIVPLLSYLVVMFFAFFIVRKSCKKSGL
ncbi:MAG: MFS transporter [Bacteroidales bacterium]|nr:MFS transporter [Bacteroidales bacterium]